MSEHKYIYGDRVVFCPLPGHPYQVHGNKIALVREALPRSDNEKMYVIQFPPSRADYWVKEDCLRPADGGEVK